MMSCIGQRNPPRSAEKSGPAADMCAGKGWRSSLSRARARMPTAPCEGPRSRDGEHREEEGSGARDGEHTDEEGPETVRGSSSGTSLGGM
jgi:hypothetical protein